MNTAFSLMYRDADNYKTHLKVVLAGLLNAEQAKQCQSAMQDGYFVIAEQLGLPTPAEEFAKRFCFPTSSDHVWTTMADFETGLPDVTTMHTDETPTHALSVSELVTKISKINWDEQTEMVRLGMAHEHFG